MPKDRTMHVLPRQPLVLLTLLTPLAGAEQPSCFCRNVTPGPSREAEAVVLIPVGMQHFVRTGQTRRDFSQPIQKYPSQEHYLASLSPPVYEDPAPEPPDLDDPSQWPQPPPFDEADDPVGEPTGEPKPARTFEPYRVESSFVVRTVPFTSHSVRIELGTCCQHATVGVLGSFDVAPDEETLRKQDPERDGTPIDVVATYIHQTIGAKLHYEANEAALREAIDRGRPAIVVIDQHGSPHAVVLYGYLLNSANRVQHWVIDDQTLSWSYPSRDEQQPEYTAWLPASDFTALAAEYGSVWIECGTRMSDSGRRLTESRFVDGRLQSVNQVAVKAPPQP